MALHPLAGQPAPADLLVDVPALLAAYDAIHPDPTDPAQLVAFGTSGHRGASTDGSFNDDHIAAIAQALSEHRAAQGVRGPMFIGIDTHALSEPALRTALEVFAANEVTALIAAEGVFTPTPVVSHAILRFNRAGPASPADGVVITPSHNPPSDGGFKYNPPSGGPADTGATRAIQDRANELLRGGLRGVKRTGIAQGRAKGYIREHNFITPYVEDLANVIDMEAIAGSGLKFGVDPLGGSSLPLWEPIKARYGLNLTVVNKGVDPTFSFMSVDHDGKIRMDCSSPYAMASLIRLKDDFDVSWGNDPDADRHGIVTSHGLMNPNHFLAVAVLYLFQHRAGWRPDAGIGKTLVSSSIIDRVARHLKQPLVETPVGFKWFVDGLLDGSLGFGGEESAGASFLRADGAAWSTDKDGIIMDLLAAEITSVTGRNPAEHYHAIESMFGSPCYERMDAPANATQKKVLADLSPELITARELAGDPITAVLTRAPGNNAPIGGLKVVTDEGWFAARPSGTEAVYKIYAESFRGRAHLHQLQQEAQTIVSAAFAAAGVDGA